MNVYSIDVKIVATVYIKAATEEAAKAIFDANLLEGQGGEVPTNDGTGIGDIPVSGRQYDDPELPEWCLSPAISFYGAASDDGAVEFDLAEEDVEAEG